MFNSDVNFNSNHIIYNNHHQHNSQENHCYQRICSIVASATATNSLLCNDDVYIAARLHSVDDRCSSRHVEPEAAVPEPSRGVQGGAVTWRMNNVIGVNILVVVTRLPGDPATLVKLDGDR